MQAMRSLRLVSRQLKFRVYGAFRLKPLWLRFSEQVLRCAEVRFHCLQRILLLIKVDCNQRAPDVIGNFSRVALLDPV